MTHIKPEDYRLLPGTGHISVNETILRKDNAAIITAFSRALKA
jgi:hypothetical protein